VNTPDIRVQARTLVLHACDLPPEHRAALEGLRSQCAGGLRGKPPEWAQAFHDALLAAAAPDLLFPDQREALARPLLRLLEDELLTEAPLAAAARRHGLQAVAP
jgi:hypothetical protein